MRPVLEQVPQVLADLRVSALRDDRVVSNDEPVARSIGARFSIALLPKPAQELRELRVLPLEERECPFWRRRCC